MKNVNYEAEATLLGAILVDGTLFDKLEVEEEHFYYSEHKRIYRAMKEAHAQHRFIDIVVVTTLLGDAIHEVGGPNYLLQMAESVASTATLKHHENLLFDAYRRRISLDAVKIFMHDPSEGAMDVLLDKLTSYRDIGSLQQEKHLHDYLLEISREISKPTKEDLSCKTNLHAFDELTGGLQKGDLIIIAARPSVGKTAFALNLATGHCKNDGLSTIFSLEMGTKQLLKRMISSEAKIDGTKWRHISKLFSGGGL